MLTVAYALSPPLDKHIPREFMDNLVSILKMPVLNHDVKSKILRLVQDWATAFEGKPSLSYVVEVYRTLQREGTWPTASLLACGAVTQPVQASTFLLAIPP